MLIQKFGGSSLANLESFTAAAAIISKAAANEKVVVVLSAMYGITDLLDEAINAAVKGGNFKAILERINDKEQESLSAMQVLEMQSPLASAYLEKQQQRLNSRLEGVALLEQCPPQVRAEILSAGEGFSSRMMCDLLQAQGQQAVWSDTSLLPPANDSYTDSLVDIDAAAPLLQQAISGEHNILILPGFYGVNTAGKPQLWGRNGSDYSAALFGAGSYAATSIQK